MTNEKLEEPLITIRVSRFLFYVLGSLEKVPIEPEEAKVLELLNTQSIHIQWDDLDFPYKPLEKPFLWQWKYWHIDTKRRAIEKQRAEIERKASNKQRENIEKIIKFLTRKYHLPEKEATFAARSMILNSHDIDKSYLEALGIRLDALTEEEKNSLGKNYSIL